TVGCRCTSKRKCPWTSCTPRAPSPSPSSAPSAACGKCSRYASRPGDPRAPAFAPGAGAPTVRPPAPAPVSCRSTAHGAKAESNHNPRARPLRTRGGYRPGSCAGSGLCRRTALGAKAEPNPNHRARPLRTRGGYRPGSCAGSGLCRSTALGAKAESNHNPRARPHSHPGRVLLPSGLLRQPRFHVGAPPTVRKRSQTTTPEPAPIRTRGGCSYNKLVEVLGGVPFGHLFVQLAPGTVDLAAALYCGPYGDLLGPAHEVGIALGIEELGRAVHLVGHYAAIPGPDGHVGDAVLVPGDIGVVGQLPIEHVQLTLGFHGVAVDRVLVLLRRVGVEVTEA